MKVDFIFQVSVCSKIWYLLLGTKDTRTDRAMNEMRLFRVVVDEAVEGVAVGMRGEISVLQEAVGQSVAGRKE